MERKIFLVLAALAGIAAALLFLPSRDGVDADGAVGRGKAVNADAETTVTRISSEGDDDPDPEPDETTEPEPSSGRPDKFASEDANARRTSSLYYKHTQKVVSYWTLLGNALAGLGEDEVRDSVRSLARQLRDASRPGGTEEQQQAAIDQERTLLSDLGAMGLEGEAADIVDYLERALEAFDAGEPAPAAEIEVTAPTHLTEPRTPQGEATSGYRTGGKAD